MSRFETFQRGQEVFLKRPVQIYAKVIGPFEGDFGLPEEQARLVVQLIPLEQWYLPEDLEFAACPQEVKSTRENVAPDLDEESVRSDDAMSNLSAQDPFSDLSQEIDDLIANRAYELYESRGFEHGHDAEDWLLAESEILLNVTTHMAETEGELTLQAKVPGFTEHDLEVRVAPRSVCISGNRQVNSGLMEVGDGFSERRARRIFRVLDLTSEVDPSGGEASVGDGVLEVKLPKVGLRKLVPVRAKSASA